MSDIHAPNLSAVDLNLLAAFETLMAERNVTHAAEQMGLTQAAMSNTLGRLRSLFRDPILQRSAAGMVPTDRALELIVPVTAALREIRQALAPRGSFSPARSHQRFRVLMADLTELMFLPGLSHRLGSEAPGVDLEITRPCAAFPAEELRTGSIDLAVGTSVVPDGFFTKKLLDEDFACIVRRNHPLVGRRLTLARFTKLRHVLVAPFGGRGGIVDQALAAQGNSRRVAIQSRHFLIAPLLVAQSDFIATIPRRLAECFATFLPLRILPPPIELGGFVVRMVWHARTNDEPAHRWFRRLVADVAEGLLTLKCRPADGIRRARRA